MKIVPICPDTSRPRFARFEAVLPPVRRLYGCGDVSLLEEDVLIAVVGTRNPTPYGRKLAEHIAGYLARNGAVVVSGLARGIDSVAHSKALAVGGKTVGVSAVSANAVYPAGNAELYRQMWERGLVISEVTQVESPHKYMFVQRNRVIAALCDAVIVVEAGFGSGALLTANFALEYGTDVFAVPGSILSDKSKGCHRLIESGATPLYDVRQLGDIYRLSTKYREQNLSEHAVSVLRLLREHRNIDRTSISAELGLDIPIAVSALQELICEGFVVETGPEFYTYTG